MAKTKAGAKRGPKTFGDDTMEPLNFDVPKKVKSQLDALAERDAEAGERLPMRRSQVARLLLLDAIERAEEEGLKGVVQRAIAKGRRRRGGAHDHRVSDRGPPRTKPKREAERMKRRERDSNSTSGILPPTPQTPTTTAA